MDTGQRLSLLKYPFLSYSIIMSADLLKTGLAGALFGAALKLSGVYLPSVIVTQMELRSFHMLKVFLGASATSA